eukprot:TRINITY_DN7513_c0_g1_i1.p2 TRINITY_DN7513_c0_g1~~TRINITY_DN7513_c0_g1_i1.p2  ORF type:complete len:241 (-),score=35.50 TRINITY_DN7513_c0_g1_i1:43-765(-)
MLDDLASESSSVTHGRGTRSSGRSWLSCGTNWKATDRSEFFNMFPSVPSNGREAYVAEEEDTCRFTRRFGRRGRTASKTSSSSASSVLGMEFSRICSKKDDVQALAGKVGGAECKDGASAASATTTAQGSPGHFERWDSILGSPTDDAQALAGKVGGAECKDGASAASATTTAQGSSEALDRRSRFFRSEDDESGKEAEESTPQALKVDDDPEEPVCKEQKKGLSRKVMWWYKLFTRRGS